DEKGCAKKENITNFLTTMGEQYYLYIGTYSQSALAGTFDINISCATALATELVNFTGVIADENNVIRWKVADEWNIKEYVVERSADGQKDWITVGSVSASNLTNHQYELVDKTPLKNAYYRLKSYNQDGAYDTSTIIYLKRESKNALSVFPSPTTDVATVQFHTLTENKVLLRLTDMMGRTVQQQEVGTIIGQNNIPLSLGTLERGIYILTLDDNEQRKTVRVLKQ
ncbi:MAG: T9SS type A sorting domain-containing protein, partial [Saprospiraceae bacterium]